jgi:ATP-binding cassette subfamily B protein
METFMNGWAGLTRFVEIMRLSPEEDVAPGEGKPITAYDIDIEDIWFAYDEKNMDVINGVSLHVKEGETVAIVGPSGGGKTTLCQLIPRFYDVDKGVIRIGGTDIREIEKKTLRKNIGIVQQDVFLFPETIADNIRYGRPDATDFPMPLPARCKPACQSR